MRPEGALAFLAAYNVFQNAMLDKRGYVAGNLAATGVGLAWARSTGMGWSELGLTGKSCVAGLKLGVGVTAAASTIALLGRDHELVQAILDDDRLEEVTDRELPYRLLVRFPLGTALFEEVWFRGILPAALRQHRARRPELISTAAFAAWHLIPTAAAIRANPGWRELSPSRKTMLVLGGSAVAGVAGLGFAGLRKSSSSLAAPWVAHAALNGLSFWVAMRHRRVA